MTILVKNIVSRLFKLITADQGADHDREAESIEPGQARPTAGRPDRISEPHKTGNAPVDQRKRERERHIIWAIVRAPMKY